MATSAEVNAFIKRHAAESANWQALTDRINKELKYEISLTAVQQRGKKLKVATKGKRLRGIFAPAIPASDPLEDRLAAALKKRKTQATIGTLADELDVSPARIRGAMEALKGEGHNVVTVAGGIELSAELPKREPIRIDVRKLAGKVLKFGVTGDNHLCSTYERMDVLNALFDVWESQGIADVYQLGNMIDGEAPFNRHDLKVHGMEGQCKYFAENWPHRKGMRTHYVTGDDHEGWYVQREGVDIGKYLENVCHRAGRSDIRYLGHMEHDLKFEGAKNRATMRLIHAGGGSSYATSYTAQKIVESYQGGEKPNVLLIGHYHKAEYGYPREVHCLQVGCTCDQTPFMRKKKLQAHVGGWTVEMTVNPDGFITRFRQEWLPFYDLGFYDKAWKYRRAA